MLPDDVAQDRYAILARLVFFVEEVPAELHAAAQQPEEVRRCGGALQPRRFAVTRKNEVGKGNRRHLGE